MDAVKFLEPTKRYCVAHRPYPNEDLVKRLMAEHGYTRESLTGWTLMWSFDDLEAAFSYMWEEMKAQSEHQWGLFDQEQDGRHIGGTCKLGEVVEAA